MNIRDIKNRFGIIGDNPRLNSALETAAQISSTDLSVLITGESGVGKEVIPKIIHHLGARKHNNYIAINCGAIPEGTIDSELFGHEKGAFTGANEARKGYFEVANGGIIFLDEVGELPLTTQVRLLRVLESGEFLRVGSSKIQKTDVRVIAASNVNFQLQISNGKFREDLYYRLNAVPISIPPLRERKEDIHLLFKKFALDFADKYKMPPIRLSSEAKIILESYRWPGNIRQLKNVAEQISILESIRSITADTLKKYLPEDAAFPMRVRDHFTPSGEGFPDMDLILKILFQLRQDVDQIKEVVFGQSPESANNLLPVKNIIPESISNLQETLESIHSEYTDLSEQTEDENNLSIQESNFDLIRKALEKHGGKRKAAADELGISERTLYRKIKDLTPD